MKGHKLLKCSAAQRQAFPLSAQASLNTLIKVENRDGKLTSAVQTKLFSIYDNKHKEGFQIEGLQTA